MRRVQMRQGKAVFGALLAIGLFLAASVIVLSAFSPKANFDLHTLLHGSAPKLRELVRRFLGQLHSGFQAQYVGLENQRPPRRHFDGGMGTRSDVRGEADMLRILSPVQGLNLSGATENFTYENVQALPSFEPPFYAQTKVEATASHGGPVAFAIATGERGTKESISLAT